MKAVRACLLGGGLAAMVAAGSWAAKPKLVPPETLPAWAREAAARPTPAGSSGLARLHREIIVEPLAEGGVRVTARDAIRVLDATGLTSSSRSTVLHRKDDERVSHDAWALLPSGDVRVPVPKQDEYTLPYEVGGVTLDDNLLHVVEMPGLVVGAVRVEESVVVEKLDFGGQGWTLGSVAIPSAYERFEVRVPEGFHLDLATERTEALELTRDDRSAVLVGRNLAPPPPAEQRPSDERILPFVMARWWTDDGHRGFADWNAVARWSWQLGVPATTEVGEAAKLGDAMKPPATSDLLASLRKAHDFAARDVRYEAIEIGIGGWAPATPAKTCSVRHGDCKAKAWLLRALLARWGTEAFPVLVRTRHLGPLRAEMPTASQFNHAIAAVVLPDGVAPEAWPAREVAIPGRGKLRALFVDVTDEDAPLLEALPEMDQGTKALLLHGDGGVLVDLPVRPPSAADVSHVFTARVDAEGLATGAELRSSWLGAAAPSRRSYMSGMDDATRLAIQREDLQERMPGATIASFDVSGLEDVNAGIVATTKLVTARVGKKVGPLLVLTPGALVGGMSDWSFPPPPREWPYVLTMPFTSTVELQLQLPPGLVPEELPSDFELATPHVSVRSSFTAEGDKLRWSREARILQNEVAPEDYPAFREAVLRYRAHERSGIVLVAGP